MTQNFPDAENPADNDNHNNHHDSQAASAPQSAAASSAAAVPATHAPPSVHIRAFLTWLAIFPLVSLGMLAFAPLWPEWHPVLRALVLTALVVPLAVYLVVPNLLKGHGALRRRRRSR